jgi:dTDP-4-dehydrorhamnose reductase
MKVFITGSNGQLGRSLTQKLDALGITKFAFSRNDLDIRNESDVRSTVREFKPDYIVNSAAFTAVDKAESEYHEANQVNSIGPLNLAIAAKENNCRLIHISTDYVFNGDKKEPYSEEDPTNPVNVYGRTKVEGEENIKGVLQDNYYIFRTSWLYSEHGRNFAKTMVKKALETNDLVSVVADQYGQPTYAGDLAIQLIKVMQQSPECGIYNATNSGETNWYEFARKIFVSIGENENRIKSLSSNEYITDAVRPKYSVLTNNKWQSTNISPMRDWGLALNENIGKISASVKGQNYS